MGVSRNMIERNMMGGKDGVMGSIKKSEWAGVR